MTFAEFVELTRWTPWDEYDHRGAHVWAQLEKHRPDLADRVRGTGRDCSQWTMNLQGLWPWLEENWETET